MGLLYAMHWPFRQYESARGIRRSPLHDRLAAAGAVLGELAGWERPNWYATRGQEPVYEYSYGEQNWQPNLQAECGAVRRSVGLFDQTSFAKLSVQGPDALAVLDRVSANAIDVEPGHGVYTQWLNDRGGIESDLTVHRLADDDLLVVTAAAGQRRDWTWLERASRGRDVHLSDVTDDWAVLGVMGPNARRLLRPLTDTDLGHELFPFGAIRPVSLAGTEALALRMSYVGELGWELYVRAGDAAALYDSIVAAGPDHELVHAGYHAMNALRLESGYRHWGHDITDEDTPLEAGLGFAVAWDKPGGFVGREALLAQKGQPLTKRLTQFRLEDPDRLLYHDEPIYRDHDLVGRTSSGLWSQTQARCLAMGYVNHHDGVTADWLDAGVWEIEVAGTRVPATASLRAFFDPRKERVKI
ncbi:MAG: hypothetical protein GY745_12640 [Actinomycetia bacterium]|nr:hypothetical protein [Actinomycetes bacterium]